MSRSIVGGVVLLAVVVVTLLVADPTIGAATSDCEAVRTGSLAQPANAWSALGLGVVGVVALWAGPSLLGSTVVAASAASFAAHGTVHDAAEVADGVAVAALATALVVTTRPPVGWWAPAAVVAVGALAAIPGVGSVVQVVVVAAAGIALVSIGRLGALAVAIAAGGYVVWGISRTDGPWCEPTSLAQGHALWHLLAAIVVAVGLVAIRRHIGPDLARSS